MLELAKFVSLFQKVSVAASQIFQTIQKDFFGNKSEEGREGAKLFPTQCLRMTCQITTHNCLLVEQT